MFEEADIRPRRCVVKLIHNDDIEVLRTKTLEAGCRKALNRRKDVLKPLWFMPVNPELPESRLPQRMAKRRLGLRQNLLAVSYKQ